MRSRRWRRRARLDRRNDGASKIPKRGLLRGLSRSREHPRDLEAHVDHTVVSVDPVIRVTEQNQSERPIDARSVASDEGPTQQYASISDATQARAGFGWLRSQPRPGEADQVTIGAPSTFGTSDWWSSGWWPIAVKGDAGDIQADFGTCGDVAVAGVALRGNKHRLAGAACEDAFHIRAAGAPEEPFVLIAVCDGVGSAANSRFGARRLSRDVARKLAAALRGAQGAVTPELIQDLLTTAVRDAVGVLTRWAEENATPLADLETTLTVAVIPVAPNSAQAATVGVIGDSPAFYLQGSEWRPVADTGGESTSIISTATRGALTSGRDALALFTAPLPPGNRLLLCTDGVGQFMLDGDVQLELGRHLAQALEVPCQPLELLRHAMFDLRSADDDRTMVVVWRAPRAQ